MVIVGFQVQNKLERARFLQKIFLVANTNTEVVFGMLFLTFNKIKVDFAQKKRIWRTYITVEAIPTTKKIQIIDQK